MPSYKAPADDVLFLLNNVLHMDRYANLPGFSEATPDVVRSIVGEAARICEEVLQPINQSGDREGCQRHPDSSVSTPAGFKAAYRAYADGGWIGLATDPAYGGQGLPYTIAAVMNEFSASANMAFAMYPGLTTSALAALNKHGSEAQKRLYSTKMAAGTWSGTMNLTEPQCGTDLGLLKTKAVPLADGSYAITGQKIFISAGEHDLTENIIHLVLARIEGAPAGTKGISLFLVPKFIPDATGAPGLRNSLSCGAIERKMGIHGNPTCVMNYDGAKGWLIGSENRGLNAMFVMMNEARLGVAVQGLAQSEVAYQNAVAYAKERLQMRALTGPKFPEKPADPIIVHPDIRRNLMEMKAFNEAGRALVLWTALRSDVASRSSHPEIHQSAEDLLGLMTPVLKGVLTDRGFENTVKAQQIFGGHGYIRESGMEQFVRDARITMIYEGANGIQALDLIGRKLPANGGRAAMGFFNEVASFIKDNTSDSLKPYLDPLRQALAQLQQATMWFMENAVASPDNAGAGSYAYMHMFGLVALAYMWARIGKAALAKKSEDAGAAAAMDAKLQTGKFFMAHVLPETASYLATITAGAETMMAMPAEMF
jgi:alkylation response protein AidB-like acyl-CoA dehydrogenase